MLDKIKDLGAQAASKTNEAIDGLSTSVKTGVENLTNSATTFTEGINEKAVRASTSQVYRILEIALEELKGRPLSDQPISLTASVNIGIAALELQIHLNQEEKKQSNDSNQFDTTIKINNVDIEKN